MFQNNTHLEMVLDQSLCQMTYEIFSQTQAPTELIVGNILQSMSAAASDLIKVALPSGSTSPTSLYLCAIAGSGEGKSAVDNLLKTPFLQQDRLYEQQYKEDCKKYAEDLSIWKIKNKAMEKELDQAIKKSSGKTADIEAQLRQLRLEKPQPPIQKQKLFDDATIPALLLNMHRSPVSAYWTSPEAGSFFRSVNSEMTKHLNALWSGERVSVQRKSTDSFIIENKPLTIGLGIQPELFEMAMKKHSDILLGSGLLARFLVYKPNSVVGNRYIREGYLNGHALLTQFNNRISMLLQWAAERDARQPRTVLSFDAEASRLWLQKANELENNLNPNNFNNINDINAFATKAMNQVARIAAVYHFFLYGQQDGQTKAINSYTLNIALDLVQYFIGQAKALFGEKTLAEQAAERVNKLIGYLIRKNRQSQQTIFSLAQLNKNSPHICRGMDNILEAVNTLVAKGLLVSVPNSINHFGLTLYFFQQFNLSTYNVAPMPMPMHRFTF